jgi:hypothetical protein
VFSSSSGSLGSAAPRLSHLSLLSSSDTPRAARLLSSRWQIKFCSVQPLSASVQHSIYASVQHSILPACNQYLPVCGILFCHRAIDICERAIFYFVSVQSIFASVRHPILLACNRYLPACDILFCQRAIDICQLLASYFASVQSIFASVQYSILSACNQYLPACDIRSICQRAIDICQRATSHFASVQSIFASVQYSILPACNPIFASFHSCLSPPPPHARYLTRAPRLRGGG